MSDDLISRQSAIEVLAFGKEMLGRVLDDMDVVGTDREKYSWGLALIESYIYDIEELPSAQPVAKDINVPVKDCISRQDAIDALETISFNSGSDYVRIRELLEEMPTIDAVPVIMCKDCKYAYITNDGECKYCNIWFPVEAKYLDGDYYCASAERKES